MNKNTIKRIALAEKIVELRRLGYTNHQIIEQLNTSYMTVYNALKNEGLKPLRKNQVEKTNRVQRIDTLRNEGLSNVQIGEIMNLHPGTVSRLSSNLKTISEKDIRQQKIDKILELKRKGFSRKEVANMLDFEYKFVWRHWHK
jgi:DNA-binding CsgD family transcriptional regulator